MDCAIIEGTELQGYARECYIYLDTQININRLFMHCNHMFKIENLVGHIDEIMYKYEIILISDSSYNSIYFRPGDKLSLTKSSVKFTSINEKKLAVKSHNAFLYESTSSYSSFLGKSAGLIVSDPKPINTAGQNFKTKLKPSLNVIIKENTCQGINYIDVEHRLISQMIDLDIQGKTKEANQLHDQWIKLTNYEK